jgi:hypothetical protein
MVNCGCAPRGHAQPQIVHENSCCAPSPKVAGHPDPHVAYASYPGEPRLHGSIWKELKGGFETGLIPAPACRLIYALPREKVI